MNKLLLPLAVCAALGLMACESATGVVGGSRQDAVSAAPLDSDNDGLTDAEEAALGTNPFQKDSDTDGLDDGEEVLIGTDPLFPDTDRDGVVDGDDVDPLANLAVSLTLLAFEDHTRRAVFLDGADAYLVFSVGDQQANVDVDYFEPVIFDVPDDVGSVLVVIRAFEGEGSFALISGLIQMATGFSLPAVEQAYDISSSPNQSDIGLMVVLDRAGPLPPPISGNGLDDGSKEDPNRYQASVTVGVKVIEYRE
ncbi:MAG: hypothetical protein IID01_01885 [Chloroflexi bacterium]|nr:hypothetical protein [Chloroflexota bacterium]